MFIRVTIQGKDILVNTNAITSARVNNKNVVINDKLETIYVPVITILPGKDLRIELPNEPFTNYEDCLNALNDLLNTGTIDPGELDEIDGLLDEILGV